MEQGKHQLLSTLSRRSRAEHTTRCGYIAGYRRHTACQHSCFAAMAAGYRVAIMHDVGLPVKRRCTRKSHVPLSLEDRPGFGDLDVEASAP